MSAHIFAFCLSLLLAKKWVFPRQIFLFIFFFFGICMLPAWFLALLPCQSTPKNPFHISYSSFIFLFFSPLHFEGESIYCFFRFILFFFFAWFYVARVTNADFVTCYYMLLIPAHRPLYFTFKPFDTHIVAANVQVRMCWFKRFFFWEINSLLINNTHLFTNQIIHLSWHFF